MLHMLKHIAYCQPLSCLLALSCIRYVDTKQLQSYHFIYKTIRKGLHFIKKTDLCQLSVPPAASWYACHIASNPMRTLHLPCAMLTYCMARAMLLPAQRPTKPTATLAPT